MLGAEGAAQQAAVEDNLARDTMEACTPGLRPVFTQPMRARQRVTGDMRYIGLDPREYAYDLAPSADDPTRVEVEVRIHFAGELARAPGVTDELAAKLEQASRLWTEGAPGGFARFRFVLAPQARAAHFVVWLAPGTPRTPFDVTWGRGWSAHLMAHEIGHMMGLDDEYEQARKTWGHAIGEDEIWDRDPRVKREWLRCDLRSLMCDSKGEASRPLPYHYYLILRRRFCRVAAPTYMTP